jgi:hypothetical protein
MATPGTIQAFPAALQSLVQVSFLERLLREGLDSVLAYRLCTDEEPFPPRLGETITKTRSGRFAPPTAPLSVQSSLDLNNGMTAQTGAVEQFTATMNPWGAAADLNLFQDLAGLASQAIMIARNQPVQAAQTIERIAKKALFSAYIGGQTRVISGGTLSTTTAHVDDIRGFQYVWVNGIPVAVSGTNTLSVIDYGSASQQTLTVTGVTADGSNVSTLTDGVSGQITFSTATQPVIGDAFVAAGSPRIIRPRNVLATNGLTSQDVLTLGAILDAGAYLRDNGVPPRADGNFHCILDNTSLRELFGDQQFMIAYAGRYQAREWQEGDIIRLLNTTFVPTTETYVQNPVSNGNAADIPVKVRRPIVVGAGVQLETTFGGVESFLRQSPVNSIADIYVINNVAQIIRPPIDRLGQWVSWAWYWAGDFPVPTDVTATTSVIPTASGSVYKRGVALEVAG